METWKVMKVVRQRNGHDCGIAVAAMIGRCSYLKAMRADPNPNAERGVSVLEMANMLKVLTGKRWRVFRPAKFFPIKDILSTGDETLALIIERPQKAWRHWIVVRGGKIYDPNRKRATTPGSYPRGKWRVIRVVREAESV